MRRRFILLATACLLAACTGKTTFVETLPDIYPDYIGVTVPVGIAPLNFTVPDNAPVRKRDFQA